MIRKLKNNRFVRGLYFFYKSYFRVKKRSFGKFGANVILTPPYYFGNPKNIFIGDNVGVGPYCFISATNAKFVVKNNCAIAERLTVHTGNHAQIVGKFVTDITESDKPMGYDQDVIIEEDVWIGCNVTLLSGVTIGRGCIIAAGSVVNKSCPPYSIIAGIPSKIIKFRWTLEEIIQHEKALYNEQERLNINEMKEIFKLYAKQ
jgi:acetyltransferase-like isoleucine patch superfamily enzyme